MVQSLETPLDIQIRLKLSAAQQDYVKGKLAHHASVALTREIKNRAAVDSPISQMRLLVRSLRGLDTVQANVPKKELQGSDLLFLLEGSGRSTRTGKMSPWPVSNFAVLDFGGSNCSVVKLAAAAEDRQLRTGSRPTAARRLKTTGKRTEASVNAKP